MEDIKVEKIYYTEDGEKHDSYIEAYYHVAFVEAKKALSQVINIMPSECERLKKDLDRDQFEETAKDIMILKIISRAQEIEKILHAHNKKLDEVKMNKFQKGQLVIYKGANGYEIGKIKRIKDDKSAFIWYHSGDTALLTDFDWISPIVNDYCFKDLLNKEVED